MSKSKKRKNKKKSFSELEQEIFDKSKEKINISESELSKEKRLVKINNQKNLALSFKYMTENKNFNFYFLNKNKIEGFFSRLTSVLKRITSLKIKDLFNPPFKDKFLFSVLYEGTYKNSIKTFCGTEQVISIEIGGKSKERIVVYYENNEEEGDNILYVLGFDFNHDMYKHKNSN